MAEFGRVGARGRVRTQWRAVRLTYVLPRYGTEVVGGAELAIRLIAERLVALPGWEVSVLTTCALDSRTWADWYPAGSAVVNGVRVERFSNPLERDPDFDAFSNKVLLQPGPTRDEQTRWIDMQGPFSPELLNAVASCDADLVVFKPYLYYPTVRGVPLVSDRAVMHPAAHDEPALRLPLFRSVFAQCQGFVYNMAGERALVESVCPEASAVPSLVSGFGIEPPASVDPARGASLADGAPYVVSVGRVDGSKGSLLLARWFAAYKDRHPGPLRLVLVGQVADEVPEASREDVVLTGVVDDDVKWAAVAGALAVVQPSPYESLSLALLEGWAVGRPAVVNAACAATSEHVRASGGGLVFDGYASFEVVLERLVSSAGLRDALGEAGRGYVERLYRWPRILSRYAAFMESLTAGRPRPGWPGRSPGR
jgi:glycosyltransferase involved in cell wall biosynthesis